MFGLWVALALPAWAAPAAAEPPHTAYFVQSACLDAAGQPIPGRIPLDPGCDRRRPLRPGEPLPYRKHDWPGAGDAPGDVLALGYQASDSLLGTLFGAPAAIQTFDFGHAPRDFGRLDPGEGGQIVPLPEAGDLSAAMTEDSTGVQWFMSGACRPGWLFATPPLTEAWQQRVVGLNITPSHTACPERLNPSLTRWRRARIALPWRESADGRTGERPAEVLVSEHFGGATIAMADSLERFWFAEDLGLVRWERWENAALSQLADRAAMAELIARSRRCPAIAFDAAPAPRWQMVDCRTWTNMQRLPARSLDWPAGNLR